MPMKPFNRDEQEFLQSVGLKPDQLEALLDQQPVTPALQETEERIRAATYRKLSISPDQGGQTKQPDNRRDAKKLHNAAKWWRRSLPAAVAVLLLVTCFSVVAQLPSAQAAIEKLLFFVPGLGIAETSNKTLVLQQPVTVESPRGSLTVAALISNGEYTELRFRIDDLPSIKPDPATMDRQPLEASLVLPSGIRLTQSSAQTSAGHSINGSLWFPALPEETESVTLDLSPIHGLSGPFTAQLPVVDIALADFKKATAGGWSAFENGVMLGAPHVATNKDRIILTLDSILQEKGARVDRFNETLSLTDDLGNSYPLITEESELDFNTGRSNQAVFHGPVDEQAHTLHLAIDAVEVLEEGVARLRVPLNDLTLNEPVELNEELRVGRWPITVRSITRLENDQSDDRFAVDLDLGPANEREFLRHLHLSPYRAASSGSAFQLKDDTLLSQGTSFEVFYEAKGRYLDLRFDKPTVRVFGPWNIEIPLDHQQ